MTPGAGPASGRLSVVPVPPTPPVIDRLAVFAGTPVPNKKCTTVAICDELISQCYADADNPGDWACHGENVQGQCTTGTCIFRSGQASGTTLPSERPRTLRGRSLSPTPPGA